MINYDEIPEYVRIERQRIIDSINWEDINWGEVRRESHELNRRIRGEISGCNI